MTEAWLGLIASDSFSSQQKHCSPAAGRGSIQGFREHTQTWTKTEGFLQQPVYHLLTHILTLNSSEISDMKEEICFMSRSMLLSLPVFSSVVMARVAMLRLESVTRFSRSRLQAVTADGCFMATWRGRGKVEGHCMHAKSPAS